jgi:hypothetical protein
LTCFPSTTTFVLVLGADSPCSDERRAGNLGLTARGLFTPFNATHVSIRTSDTSSSPLEPPSQAYRTLPYHVNASLEFAQGCDAVTASPNLKKERWLASTQDDLPVAASVDDSSESKSSCSIERVEANSSEAFTSAASVIGLAPLHLPRRKTRSVSYYAFFEGWLLLSQLPDCLSLSTSFPT